MPPKMKSIKRPAAAPATTTARGGAAPAPKRKKGGGRRVSRKALTQFTTQFAILSDAGLPVVRCLRVLEGQLPPGMLKRTLDQVTEDVESGSSLSEALAKHPGVFDDLFVNMTKAGEAGGVLDTIMRRLADFMEKAQRIRRKVITAAVYPAVVLTVALAILMLIMIFVVPKFEVVFNDIGGGQELPAITRMLQGFSNWLVGGGWLIVVAIPILIWLAVKGIRRTPKGGRAFDRFVLRLPIVGRVVRKTLIARFSRTFGTLIASGVPILEALNIVKGALTNRILQEAIDDVHDAIREGENIATPLGETGIFDDLVVNMIDVGEETGELDQMLMKVADTYDEEIDEEVTMMIGLLEPLLIVFMGGAVFFIVLALFLPLITLVEKLGQTT